MIPNDPGSAIIKGAVRFGPLKAIAYRTSPATYGIECRHRFREGDDDPKKKIRSEEHKDYYCREIFSVIVTKGQKLDPTESYHKKYSPVDLGQTDTISIYATDAQEPKYVTDRDCVKIGEVYFDMDHLLTRASAEDCCVTVSMEFSGPEIVVSAYDSSRNGNQRTIDFLPSSQYNK